VNKTEVQNFQPSTLTRKILGNSIALFSSQLLAKVFRVVANFLLARYLGPENFGIWTLVLTFTELFRFIPDFGLERTLVRRMARNENRSGLSATLFLRGLFSGLAILAIWGALFLTGYNQNVRLFLYLYSLSFFLQSVSGAFSAYFQAQLKSAALIWAYTASGVLYLLLVLTGILGQQNTIFFLSALLATEGILLTLFAFTFFKKGEKLTPFSFGELGPMVKEATPFVVWLGLGTIYYRMDTLLVYHFVGEKGAGLYAACFRLSEGFLLIATAAASSLFPVFSRLQTENNKEFVSLFQKSFFWFFVPAPLIAILIMGLSHSIINFLYGQAFAPAAAGLSVIIWSVPFMFANILSTKAIVACNKETSITKITALNLVINLGLNFYLLPRYGFIGACWATVATEALNFFLQFLVLQKLLGKKLLTPALPYLLPPAAAGLWFVLHPASFQTAGVWLFSFGYLTFFLNRKPRLQ